MATQNPKNQLALDLGDTTAKLSVRDLVVRGEIETPTPRTRKPRPAPTFERALVDGADCALRRRCGAKSELLVLLATQGQAYVMDERTGRRHALTAGRLAAFCSGAHDDALTPPWSVDALQDYDPAARKAIVQLFACDDFCQMARRDMVRVSAWELARRSNSVAWGFQGAWDSVSLMWRLVEPVVGHDVARDALSSAMGTLATYLGNGRSYAACELFGGSRSIHDVDAFLGRDRTRMLVSDVLELGESVESGYMGDVTSAMAHLVGTLAGLGIELDRSRLCRHAMRLLAQPPRRYHSRASSIMSWATCVEQQMYVRGHVTDPFPEDPRALEERLEMERVERRDGAQDARIQARAEALANKSYSDDAFRIRPVASASELVEEAESQHNCLATYVEAVAEGMTDIWLMRRANDPDRSHVTVEVRDGEVRQAFRACNQVPSDSELRWLAAWCERVGYRPHRGRMQALCA